MFGQYAAKTDLEVACTVLLTISVYLMQLGHMFYSATLDIMNPQNESYATTGSSENNLNENRSTIVAFIASIVFAFLGYLFMVECHREDGFYLIAFIKLFIIALGVAASSFYLFVMKIRAYYYEK